MNPRPIDTNSRPARPRPEESKKRTRSKAVSQLPDLTEEDLIRRMAACPAFTRREVRKEIARYKRRLKKQIASAKAALKALQKQRHAGEIRVAASPAVEPGPDSPLQRDAA